MPLALGAPTIYAGMTVRLIEHTPQLTRTHCTTPGYCDFGEHYHDQAEEIVMLGGTMTNRLTGEVTTALGHASYAAEELHHPIFEEASSLIVTWRPGLAVLEQE